jgi:CRISPR-associated endoribonuclease Cas6
MRIELTLYCPELVPFDHLPMLKSAFHRWTGFNPALHGGTALYSLSWLRGGRGEQQGLRFSKGAAWTISAHDPAILREILESILADSTLPHHDLRVVDVIWRSTPRFSAGRQSFQLLSPILVKHQTGRTILHLLYDDPKADDILTKTLRYKLRLAGLDDTGAEVAFDRAFETPKTKLFRYGKVLCRANFCPVIVTGTAEQIGFAWTVGIGHSTGIGCGALK